MADAKKLWQLVNVENQNPLDLLLGDSQPDTGDWRYCDVDLDSNGNIRTVTEQNAIVQSTLKCVFTEKQDSGYGTGLYDLIGEKDVVVRRVSLLIDITMAMLAMKGFIDVQAVAQDLTADDMIAAVSQFAVTEDETDPSVSRVTMTVLTNSGAEVAVGVL